MRADASVKMLPALFLSFFFFFMASRSSAAAASMPIPSNDAMEHDRGPLLAFKDKLASAEALSSWNQSTHFCQWQGVTCSLRHPQRVSALDLPSSGLSGAISPSIGNLTFLQRINLSSNGLYAEIPSSIGRLRRLRYLDLSLNSIRSEIPINLSYCSNLRFLCLSGNQLFGTIPPSLGSLTKLAVLDLANNSITGLIPTSLANLSSLTTLNLYINHIEGAIPEGLGNLGNLIYLQLSGNDLSGVVPPSLYNLSSLRYFALSNNRLHGKLPIDMGNSLPSLQGILLSYNLFTGTIPTSITNCSRLESFAISFCSFSGRVPPEIGRLQALSTANMCVNQLEAQSADDWEFLTSLTNCTNLQELYLDTNMFAGVLPPFVANLSSQLRVLTMGGNAISGNMPFGIGNLVSLEILVLYVNHLTGTIPESIGQLQNLKDLALDANNFSGQLPSSFGNLTQMIRLTVSYNALEGSIPASLGHLQSLNVLLLSNNFFSGSIPKEIVSLSSLSEYLDLSTNSFTGSLPLEVGSLTNLRTFNVSGNKLIGQIPGTLGNCEILEYLALDNNFFQGSIPPTLSNIRGLRTLNLSKNNLSGTIPQNLGNIDGLQELYLSHNNLSGLIPLVLENLSSLAAINLSFNQLQGPVPTKGIFQNISTMSVVGNDGLCGGVPVLHLPACSIQSPGKRHSRIFFTILIPVASLCLILLLVTSVFIYKKNNCASQSTLVSPIVQEPYPKVSYAELLKATEGFDTSNLIGRGRYGTVYKGNLESENKTVAVKVFNLQQSGSSKSFIAECEALRYIRHRNLVKIITCCSSIDSNGNDFKALVFEFMPNRSLDRWLHPQLEDHHQLRSLSLMQRLKIAIDIAEALDYLHCSCQPPTVHCDLKPSNILLNEDMVAHIGDFGLARLLPEAISRSLADSRSSIGIRGSIGYVAPEYGEGGPTSTAGDIYSFGVIVLELLTGKSPVDDTFKDGLTLHKFVEMRIPERVMELADPALLLLENDDFTISNQSTESNSTKECLISVARIGLACSKHSLGARMGMSDAAAELRAIMNAYVKP